MSPWVKQATSPAFRQRSPPLLLTCLRAFVCSYWEWIPSLTITVLGPAATKPCSHSCLVWTVDDSSHRKGQEVSLGTLQGIKANACFNTVFPPSKTFHFCTEKAEAGEPPWVHWATANCLETLNKQTRALRTGGSRKHLGEPSLLPEQECLCLFFWILCL